MVRIVYDKVTVMANILRDVDWNTGNVCCIVSYNNNTNIEKTFNTVISFFGRPGHSSLIKNNYDMSKHSSKKNWRKKIK